MKVLEHNDNAIRMIDTFKHYNREMTEIIEDDNTFRTVKGVEGKVFCGRFKARIYIGTKPMGVYEFDCRHWLNLVKLSEHELKPRISRVGKA